MAEPQLPVNASNLAFQGQRVNLEDYPKVTSFPNVSAVSIVSKYDDYEPDVTVDLTDLANINKEITNLRIRLHGIRKELKIAERFHLKHKYAYESEKKRIWIGITGGSDKSREALAEVMKEELYSNFKVAEAVAKELSQHNRDMRMELDALKELSNNQRRQIDIM